MTDGPDDPLRERLVLLLALAPPDGRAIMAAMEDAGIETKLCTIRDLAEEVRAGVGVIVLAGEILSKLNAGKLTALTKEEPIWSDIPMLILTTPKRDVSENWCLIRNTPSIHNATFLERPMRIATLVQAIKVALRGRAKQYRLRDQLLEREQLLEHSKLNEQSLSAVLNNTRMAVFFIDNLQNCTFINAAAEELTGFSLTEMQGRSLHETIHHTYPDGRSYPQWECPIDRAFPEDTRAEGEEAFIHKDGHFYPVAFTASPIRNNDSIVGTVIEARDITQKKAERERLQMMVDELNHRVKNTLVTVQSIVVQTLQGETISDHARNSVLSRLMALSRSHDLLTEKSWISVPLREIVYRALEPFGATTDASGKFSITGDAFQFLPKPALAITMALHELATNAVKYGALSVEGGLVDLSWNLVPDDILQLKWIERGGPVVEEPVRRGFGRRLVERGLAHEFGVQARISFHHQGVICEINIPLQVTLLAQLKTTSNGQTEHA